MCKFIACKKPIVKMVLPNTNIKYIFILLIISFICSCKSVDPIPEENTASVIGKVTFAKNIQPLIRDKCAPCHVAGGDRSNKYDDYNTLNTLITGVIGRVIKEKSDPLFMPKNGVKLNTTELNLLRKWIDDGQLEK